MRWLGMWCLALALLVTPLAVAQSGDGGVQGRAAAGEGDPIIGGERNPGALQTQSLGAETEIIAETAIDTYGTRQSNKGAGGGAIYGCRSTITSANLFDPKTNTPCVRVNNLSDGLAFQFSADGPLGGAIEVGEGGGDGAKPFVTNATGVATGLNADRVDGLNAEQIIAAAGSGPVGPQGPPGPPAESISTFTTYFEALDGDQSEVTLAENGPLRYFARCTVDGGGFDRIEVLVESTTGDAFEEDEGQLTADTPAVI